MQELTREETQAMRELTEILMGLPEEERRKFLYMAQGVKIVMAGAAG